MSKRESLLMLVQDNDGSSVESRAKEELRRNDIVFHRVLAGQKSEFSCVLYIEEIVSAQKEKALRVLQGAFIVLEENFEDERREESTDEMLRRQQQDAVRLQLRNRLSCMLRENGSPSPFHSRLRGDAPFMNN